MPGRITSGELRAIALVVVAYALVLWWQWVGLLGSDDLAYGDAARAWLAHAPALAHSHWGVRYPVVFPVALAFRIGGVNEASLVLPSLLYFVVALVTLYVLVRRSFGAAEAAVALLVVLTIPITPTVASTLYSDTAELCFDLISLYAFLRMTERGGPVAAVVSGLALALAFMARETSFVLVLFYAARMIWWPGVPRSRYLLLFAAAAVVVAAQTVFLWSLSGDWLYRQHLDLHHDQVDRAAQAVQAHRHGFALDREGNVTVNPYVDPLLALLAAPKYGLVFYAIAIAAVGLLTLRRLPFPQARATRLLAAVCGLWLLFVLGNFAILFLVPRYLFVPAVLGSALVAIFWVRLWRRGTRWPVVLMASAVAGCGLLFMTLQDTQPLFADRMLARYVTAQDAVVYADRRTAASANFLLESAGSARRVLEGAPAPGALAAAEVAPFYQRRGGAAVVDPGAAGATEAARFERAMRVPGRIALDLDVARLLPDMVWRKISQPSAVLVIYRTAYGPGAVIAPAEAQR